MRLTPALLPMLVLLGVTVLTRGAAAQNTSDHVPKGAEEDALRTVEVVTEEPEVPERDALAYNAEILDELLSRSTAQMIREDKFAAAAAITGGTILLGFAGWGLIEDDPRNQYSRGLGVMFMTLGMADLTTGVYAATRIPHEKRRFDRWEKARKDGITNVELAHFEGELQASREIRRGQRLLVRWNSLTHALAGLLVIALVPVPDGTSGADRVPGYIIGGLFTVVGFATFGTSFRKTPSEKAWNEYNARKMPMPGHELTWGVAPSISRRGAGLSVGGTF